VSQIWSWLDLNLLEHIMQSAMSRVRLTCAVLLVLSLMACGKSTVTPEKVGGVDPGGTPVEGRPEIPKPDPPKPQPPIVSSEPKGKWSDVFEFPSVPISAALMPNGKVVTFSSWDRFAFSGDIAQRNRTFTATFDPGDDSVSERLVTETKHDMFCPGTALLSD
jgi:hypothetical protein